jgi:tetratricopeptide (TPR) repeat protein
VAFDELGQFEKTIEDFTSSLMLNPKDATVYFSRALAYHKTGQHNKAIADYSRTLELEPECSEASKNKALAMRQMALREQTDKLNSARLSAPENRKAAAKTAKTSARVYDLFTKLEIATTE